MQVLSPKVTKERIKVFARCRPPSEEEKKGVDDFKSCVEIKGNEIKVSRPNHQPKAFTFDGIFGQDSSQEQVFKTVSVDAIEDVFNGYHSTIFVYGQTGTGKHTLSNIDDLKPEENGLIPRCIQEIFHKISKDTENEYRVRMNYLQIYMETLQDLLQPEHKNLQIREDPELGIYVSGICFRDINNFEECLKYYREGDVNRITALTKMNATSSRSHSCLIINIQKSSKINGNDLEGLDRKKVTTANLFLVDLAGSERLKKTEAEGIRKKEANYINLSLTTLGLVIHSLEANHIHIPFRDSKLTRLLQDSLGGNGKTRIVITISPSVLNSQETIGSLMFGERAMNVKTAAKINESVDYRAMYVKLKAQLDSLEEKYSELEEDYLDVSNENEKMDIEIEQLLEENKKLVKEKKILEKEKEKEKEKIVSLMKGDLLDLETQHEYQIKELNDKISTLSREYEYEFSKKEQSLKRTILEKDSEIDRLELLIQELISDKSSVDSKLSIKEKEVENLTTSIEQLGSELEISSNLCSRRENELEQVQEFIQQLEYQLSSQKDTINNYLQEIETLRRTISFNCEELEINIKLLQIRDNELKNEKLTNRKLCDEIEFYQIQLSKEREKTQHEIQEKEFQKELFKDQMERELKKERELYCVLKEQKNVELEQLKEEIKELNLKTSMSLLQYNEVIGERELEIENLKLIICDERAKREMEREIEKLQKEEERMEKDSINLELQYYKDKIEEFTSKVFSTPINTTILNIVEETSDTSSILQAPPIPAIEKVPIFDFGKIVNVQSNVIKRYEQQYLSLMLRNLILGQQSESMLRKINELETEKKDLEKELSQILAQFETLHLEIEDTYAISRISKDEVSQNSELFGKQLHQTLFGNGVCNRTSEIMNGELKDLKFISKKSKEESPVEAAHETINYMIWALEYSHPYTSFSDNLLGEENSKEIIKSLLMESEKRVKSSKKTTTERTLEIDCIWKHVQKTLDCFYDSSIDEFKNNFVNIEYQQLFNNYLNKKEGVGEEEMTDKPKPVLDLLPDSMTMLTKIRMNCVENSERRKLLSYWLCMSSGCLQKSLNREEINHKAGVYLMHEFIHLLHTVRNVLYLFDCSERDVLIYKLALHGCASKLSKFINSSEEVRKEMEERIASYEKLRTRTEAALVIQRFYRKTKKRIQEELVRKQRTELIAQSQSQMIKIRELQKSELTFKATVGKQIADTGRVLIKQGVSELDHIFNILKAYFLYGDDDDAPMTSPSSPKGNTTVQTTPEKNRSIGSMSPSPPNPLKESFGGRPKSAVSRAYSKRFSEMDVAEINNILASSNTKVSPTARKALEKSLPSTITKK